MFKFLLNINAIIEDKQTSIDRYQDEFQVFVNYCGQPEIESQSNRDFDGTKRLLCNGVLY